MSRGSAAAVVICAFLLFAAPSGALAALPPNPNDPCTQEGRDTCGTAGTGFYRTSRYGTRWFGDFRGAVPGHPHAFCIDFRFWYASRSYRYREGSAAVLRNRDGAAVAPVNQQKMAYAIWNFGRTTRPRRQAAVMLYVHSLMGDARPGEIDPHALTPGIAGLYATIARTAARYHGPYRIEASLPRELTVGRPATATVRVLSATGQPLPDAALSVSVQGARAASQVRADGNGRAAILLTPTAVDMQLRLATLPLAPSRPTIFVPSTAAAGPNGQRLAVATPGRSTTVVSGHARPVLTGATSLRIVKPGAPVFERILVAGLGSRPAPIEVELFGPFPSEEKISCTGRPYWSRRMTATGEREIRTPSVELAKAGFYAYRTRLLGSGPTAGVRTSCRLSSTTTLAVPRIVTGRGDRADEVRLAGADGRTPVRLRSRELGISAPVVPVGIDVEHGVLAVPTSIRRTGWWRDGMPPGSHSGTTLIAGHVDSADAGAGALFKLPHARSGQRVRVTTADGRVYTYRVVSVRSYPKQALPTAVYARAGAPRLVIVTCGGRFDTVSGHYLDNVVVTAVPV